MLISAINQSNKLLLSPRSGRTTNDNNATLTLHHFIFITITIIIIIMIVNQ